MFVNDHFFIHSSVEGYLGSFHHLSTVENAAINIGVPVPYAPALLSPLYSSSAFAES